VQAQYSHQFTGQYACSNGSVASPFFLHRLIDLTYLRFSFRSVHLHTCSLIGKNKKQSPLVSHHDMDPASLTIGIIGLSTVLLTTARKLRETVQDVRYAQGDLSDVLEETDLFAGTCDDFLDVCDEDPLNSERTQKLKLQLKSWTTRTVQGFDSLLDKVQAVARNPEDDYSAIEVIIAHIVWLRSKGTLKYLRASLSVARQNMICFTNIRIIEKLNVDLAQLKSVLSLTKTEKRRVEMLYNMTVEERIAITKHKM